MTHRTQGPEHTSLRDLLRTQVATQGKTPAYIFIGRDLEPTETLTYEALGLAAEGLAARLGSMASPGDRVLLAFNNDLDAVRLFWGCILAGLIPLPAPAPDARGAQASESRLRGIADNAGAKLAFATTEHVALAQAQVPEVAWHTAQSLLALPAAAPVLGTPGAATEIAYLQYTSGSTSMPRGVEITHAAVLGQCRALMRCLETDEPRGLVWLPWFHDYGLVHGVIQSVYLGRTSYLMPTMAFVLRPLKWLEAISRYGITHSGAPDFAYATCVQALKRTSDWSARLDTLELATCGAEPVRAVTLDAFANAFEPFGLDSTRLAPSYGLAEAVLAVTVRTPDTPLLKVTVDARRIEQLEVRPVPSGTPGSKTLVGCGTALPGFELRIVDPETRVPSQPDRVGEIWLRGASIGRGYWGQSELSESVFGATLAGDGADGARYLRTGDLGFVHGGELFIAGRRKDLIVVNGRNLYPQDLERTAEGAHPGVRSGGAIAVSVEKGGKEAVVLLLEYSGQRSAEVIGQLTDQVHQQVASEYQIDLHDVLVLRAGTLPRTSSGKPQRGAAQQLYLQCSLEPLRLAAQPAAMSAERATSAPAALVDRLASLWSEILGVDTVEPDANFFDLGGDSLMATQLVSRLRTRMGLELPIRALFEAPTLQAFAGRVHEAPEAPQDTTNTALAGIGHAPGAPREPGTRVPLSFSQERMWFMHELAPQGSAYNMPLALRLRGPLDVAAMQSAFQRLIERHEILRTRFVKTPEGVTAEVTAAPALALQEVHLGSEAQPASEETLHHHLADAAQAPFRLDQPPLLRAQVIHLADRHAVLSIVMHHIVGDQWSFAEMGRELAAHYNAVLAGTASALPTLPLQYADQARWHREWFTGERQAREQAFWLQRLQGLAPLSLNEDFPRPNTPDFRGAAVRLPISASEVDALRQLGADNGASLSMVLIAAIKVLLYRHTGKPDIAIGVPIANRHHLASENLIGTFVNTLVYRTDLGGDPDFRTVIGRVREVALEAFAHQDMPYELLVREQGGRSTSARQPLFNVMFNMVSSQARDCHFQGLEWQRLDFDRKSTQFDLTVIADVLHDSAITLEYATALFARETVERLGEHLRQILRAAVSSPETRVATLPLLGAAERHALRQWSLGPRDAIPGNTVMDWVNQGVQRAPQALALVAGSERLTHAQLDRASNRLARLLRERGAARGRRVGLCVGRGHDLVVAMLAILKSGAAYVPLDPEHPEQRLRHQIDDAGLDLIVTQAALSGAPALQGQPCLLLDSQGALIASISEQALEADTSLDARAQDPAYVIYTSGSTGQPKGVVVPHQAVVNLLASTSHRPGFTSSDRLLAVTTPSFDISVLELFLPLGAGGAVVVASSGQAADGRELAGLISREHITVMQATPSRWHLLLDAAWPGEKRLKALVGGEPLTAALASQLLARCGEVWNMYGPTETTVWSSCWRVNADALPAISLGEPMSNTSIQILDEWLRPCPIGVPGEICIGGAGLALGYHARAALTAERFIDQPDAEEPQERRLYRTGDLGRWRHDGSLEHLGRMDDQVKLRGFRIELGEIENRLMSHTGVARAVVTLREDRPGDPRLVAYVVPRDAMPSRDTLRQHLRHWLPEHMLPTSFVEQAQIPVLSNGKTNRRALPAPTDHHERAAVAHVAPRDATEQLVWAAWAEVLMTADFGVHDNFFDLGGHSLLAVRVVGLVEQRLQRPCALRVLFEHPTVADMAAVLAQSPGQPPSDTPIAVLQPHGRAPGLFLLAGAEMYHPFARRLDTGQPVFGVFSQTEIDLLQTLDDGPPPQVRIEKLAGEYTALIRSVQPQGPYFLGGFSIGGVLAYEVAQRLRQAGQDIGLLVLLDPMLPGRGFKHLLAGLGRRWRMFRRDGLSHLLHVYRVYHHQVAQRGAPGSQRIRAYARAIRNYRANPSDLPVLFLQAGDDASTAPAYGWRSLVPGLTIERVPGKHMDILEPPNVDELAARARRHLVAALSAPPAKAQ